MTRPLHADFGFMFIPSETGVWPDAGACRCLYLKFSGAAQAANHGANVIRVHHEAGCAIRLVYIFKYPLTLVLHPAGFAAAQRTMKVAGACSASQRRCVLDAEPSTSSYLNPSRSEFYQPRQPVSSSQDIPLAARGQDTPAARGDDIFESLIERGGVVEGTMKGDFERCSQGDKLPCPFNVHRAIGAENSKDEAAGPEATRMQKVLAHQGELVVRVEKVAASRPQEDMHGKSAAQNRFTRETVARREAAFAERGAEFDAIRSTFACGEASLDTLCTKFEDNLAH
jgi:hypothetical protein